MSKYKFNNGFIYCNGLRMSMTEVVEDLNEMSAKLHEKDREYKDLFEAFEDCQKVLGDANKRVAELEKELSRKASAFNYIDNHASNMTRRLANVDEQLAKANERVRELTKENLSIVNGVNKYSFEDAKVDFSVELNKFAIENQAKGAEALIYAFPLNGSDQMKEWVEQLRKEQE